eukprot:COSAG01_NODE_476_length_16515_cov_37.730690_17_plen_82_part_00
MLIPYTGLQVAAEREGMSAEQQGQMWLKLWTDVCKKVKATGGKCFLMAKRGPGHFVLEGNAQQGKVQLAELAQVPLEYVYN